MIRKYAQVDDAMLVFILSTTNSLMQYIDPFTCLLEDKQSFKLGGVDTCILYQHIRNIYNYLSLLFTLFYLCFCIIR